MARSEVLIALKELLGHDEISVGWNGSESLPKKRLEFAYAGRSAGTCHEEVNQAFATSPIPV